MGFTRSWDTGGTNIYKQSTQFLNYYGAPNFTANGYVDILTISEPKGGVIEDLKTYWSVANSLKLQFVIDGVTYDTSVMSGSVIQRVTLPANNQTAAAAPYAFAWEFRSIVFKSSLIVRIVNVTASALGANITVNGTYLRSS